MFYFLSLETGIPNDRRHRQVQERKRWGKKTVGKTDELKYQDLDRRVWKGKKGGALHFKPVYCWILKLSS